MRIALDATYSVDPYPSGIAVYSRELLDGLAATYSADSFLHCFRLKQWRRSQNPAYRNVSRRLLLPPLPTFRARVFHALNQRVDRRPARAVISTFHDLFVMTSDYSSAEFRRRFTHQAREAAQRSDFIIAVSAFTARQVNELLGFDISRIRIIPHGVHQPQNLPEAGREKLILFVGALQVRKNILRLVKAFESVPSDWRLVLTGSPGGYQAERITRAIGESPVRDRIAVSGFLTDAELKRLYSKASLFAFPSLDEGFGIPILEAMAYGVPVLTSNGSATAEVAGDAALLVDPTCIEDIASGLQALTENPELRKKLAESGHARVQNFTWDRTVRETYRVYQEADRL